MPLRSQWSLQREGFTFDTVLSLLKKTALNPWYTLPLYLFSKYHVKGQEVAAKRPDLAKWLRRFAILSAIRYMNSVLNSGLTNNWKNDTYDWKKEIVVVTGGSDGIGARVVQLLAERGIKVVILDIQPPKFTTRPNVHYFKCDLANPSDIRYIAASVSQSIGSPTILINNAGFARGNSILSASDTDIKLTFQINTLAHYHLAQAFLPSMISKNHGMVVTIASLAAYITSPGLVDYSASKAAALVFHEGLSAELATIHKAPAVRTICVCQGYTKTPLFEGFHKGDRFMNYALEPETVAEEIVRGVLRGQSDHIMLPRGNAYIAALRAFPLWMQAHVRKDLKKMMINWKGRQVAQPSEKSANSSPIESSGILVDKEDKE
ncbi:dehydrogenase/reductase SDR family member 8 precursor [Microthyrium microscopicum]|uniref:Short-chain dehydrogenase/reductase 3 n=1 Tax=Microthyrium microscopicum TaxID=703497 RepID=A0A6A6UFF2_9PEZI|nr:dehydrogenase/reductase SDR family member 8 precursor [Microthyrium microscopicum]